MNFKAVFIASDTSLRLFWKFLIFVLLWQVIGLLFIQIFVPLMRHDEFLMGSLFNTIMALAVFAAAIIHLKWIEKRPLEFYGIATSGRNFMQLGAGIGLGVIIMSLIVLLISLGGASFYWNPTTIFTERSLFLAMGGQIIRYFSGAFFEEFVSTAFLVVLIYRIGRKADQSMYRSKMLAILISGLVFGAFHAASPNATILSTMNISLFGILMSASFVLTHNLGFSIGFHAAWNIVQNNVFGLQNSGQEADVMLFQTELTHTSIFLTGGTFGVEGSVITTFVLLASIVFLFRKKHSNLTLIPLVD